VSKITKELLALVAIFALIAIFAPEELAAILAAVAAL
jgi:hypothetical protein